MSGSVTSAPPAADPNRVVACARAWAGTPYHHQASLRGVGTDCLGLLRGVWRDLHGAEPERPPSYSRDWGDAAPHEPFLAAARRHLIEIDTGTIQPGAVALFRMRRGCAAKHCGIVTETGTAGAHFIHAWERAGVVEADLTEAWRRRLAHLFLFPGTF